MKKKLYLFLALILLFSLLVTSTVAYLTSSKNISKDFIIHSNIDALITETDEAGNVTNGVNNALNISIRDLVYLDFQKDVVEDKYGVLNDLATIRTFSITSQTDLAFYPRVSVVSNNVEVENIPGLIYLIINDTTTVDYKALFSTMFTGLSTTNEYHQAIDSYNLKQFKNIFQNVIGQNANIKFRLVVWGDYDSLSTLQKENYETLSFNFVLKFKCIQYIYNEEATYEES